MRRLLALVTSTVALLAPVGVARAASGGAGLASGGSGRTPAATGSASGGTGLGSGGSASASGGAGSASAGSGPSGGTGLATNGGSHRGAGAPRASTGTPRATTGTPHATTGAPHATSAASPSSGTVRGTIVSVGWSQITVRPHGRTMAAAAALTAAANAVAAADDPYVWGGGHPFAGVASAAHPGGPAGFDCSGSVAAVLAGAGLWPAGTGVPSDSGLVATLRAEHLIAPGPGAVTLWDDPGTHIFMQIGQGFFGTSDGGGPSPANPQGGAGWLDDGAADTQSAAYHPWHLVAGALSGQVVYGPTVTVGVSGAAAQDAMALTIGDRAVVTYATRAHALVAATVAGP